MKIVPVQDDGKSMLRTLARILHGKQREWQQGKKVAAKMNEKVIKLN